MKKLAQSSSMEKMPFSPALLEGIFSLWFKIRLQSLDNFNA